MQTSQESDGPLHHLLSQLWSKCDLKRFPAVRLLFRRRLLLAAPLVVALSVADCSSGLVHRRPVGLFLITASPLPSPPSAPHTSSLIKDFCVCLGINLWL